MLLIIWKCILLPGTAQGSMPGRHRATPRGGSQRSPFAIIEEDAPDLEDDAMPPPWAQPWDDDTTDHSSLERVSGQKVVQPLKLSVGNDGTAGKAPSKFDKLASSSAAPRRHKEPHPSKTAQNTTSPFESCSDDSGPSTRPGTVDASAASSTAVSSTAVACAAAASGALAEPGPSTAASKMTAVHLVPPAAKALDRKLDKAQEFFPDVRTPVLQDTGREQRGRICDSRTPQERLLMPLPLFTVRRNCGMFPLFPVDASGSLSSACGTNATDSSEEAADADSEAESCSSSGSVW